MARIAFLLLATCVFFGAVVDAAVIRNSLQKTIQKDGTADIAIIFKAGVSSIYQQIESSGLIFSARGQRMTLARSALIEFTSQSQKAVRTLLDTKGYKYDAFWITNRIIVSGADASLLKELSYNPEIAEIRESIVIPVETVVKSGVSSSDDFVPNQGPVRGVFIVKGHEMWADNFTGEGIVTSNIDTGVRGTHRILRDNFLGEYGWYDPSSRTTDPSDGNGHGTHTMGTIAGRDGFGVAPDSRWMACKGCATSSCSESDLIGCGQFIACPTLTNGSNADCTKAPHVVGNSWGSSAGGDSWYDDVILGWNMAEVIGVFSAGNSGPSCGSVGSPGDRPGVIGVAASDFNDRIATFSSRGPASGTTEMKPEITAPGVEILSSVNTSDDDFDRYSGTSMASPHVTGAVALLIQKNPTLTGNYYLVRSALFGGAQTTGLTGSGQSCGQIDDNTFPNHVFGYGRLDIVAASSK